MSVCIPWTDIAYLMIDNHTFNLICRYSLRYRVSTCPSIQGLLSMSCRSLTHHLEFSDQLPWPHSQLVHFGYEKTQGSHTR